jgi:hypothetical protein
LYRDSACKPEFAFASLPPVKFIQRFEKIIYSSLTKINYYRLTGTDGRNYLLVLVALPVTLTLLFLIAFVLLALHYRLTGGNVSIANSSYSSHQSANSSVTCI